MNENTRINNKRKQTAIFNSLMEVEIHTSGTKSREEVLKELKGLEAQGKLRIYYPEGGR